MKNSLAIITFVYNEKYQLPRWIDYYSKQVDKLEDLYIVDHGSNDGSIELIDPKINVIKLTREDGYGQYQSWRVNYISNMVSDLLDRYEAVIYCDCDEYILINTGDRLSDYISNGGTSNYAIGYDVLHNHEHEPPLSGHKVMTTRSYAQFVGAMCKPVIVRNKNIKWAQGFHSSNIEPIFGDLILFHLRYADRDEGFARLKITRDLDRPEMKSLATDHQKISENTFLAWINSWLKLPVSYDGLDCSNKIIKEYLSDFEFKRDADGILKFDYSIRSKFIFKIPSNFNSYL